MIYTSEYPEHDALIKIPSMIPSREDSLKRMVRIYHDFVTENTTMPDHVTAKLLALEAFAQSGAFAE